MVTRSTILAVALVLALAGCDPVQRPGSAAAPSGDAAPSGCSRRPVPFRRSEVPAVAFARGDGPVYVGLGTAGVVRYREDTREHEGWYYYKTLWAVAPEYGGPVTITGHQLDGPNQLLFGTGGFPGTKLRTLEMSPDQSGEWRFGPGDTLIRAPGCYAFRISGDGLTQVITFRAKP
jgi:hypothetical protein